MTASRLKECQCLWLDYLRGKVALEGLNDERLFALANAGAEELPELLKRNLSHNGLADAAIEIIAGDPSWAPQVFELLTRHPERSSDLPTGLLLDYLARHQHRTREAIEALANSDEPSYDVIIPTAVEHATDLLPAFLREALRSSWREDRLVAAAVLALVDNQWSRRELTAMLEESDDLDHTAQCRAALRASRQPEAWRAADQWEASPPETGPLQSTSSRFECEHLKRGLDRVLGIKTSELHDRVMKIRNVLPSVTDG